MLNLTNAYVQYFYRKKKKTTQIQPTKYEDPNPQFQIKEKRLDDFPLFLNRIDETPMWWIKSRGILILIQSTMYAAIVVIVSWQMLQIKTNPKRPNYIASA